LTGQFQPKEDGLPELKGYEAMLAITAPQTQIISPPGRESHYDPFMWLNYFDPSAALQSVQNHVETLPGSSHERHTMRAYLGSLADFCVFCGAQVIHYTAESYDFVFSRMAMPTKPVMQEYIAHCKRRGLTSNTVTRYLAAVRHFLRALDEQTVIPHSGGDYMFIMEAQRQFRLATTIKNPAPDRTSNRPALEQFGTRLTLKQVNQLFESFEPEIHTITGKRDLALFYLGITSGLRAAELARLTMDSITSGQDCYEVRVRGKRSNHDPVGIDSTAYALIQAYVTAFNSRLAESDYSLLSTSLRSGEGSGEGLISGPVPIFQPILRGDHIPQPGLRGYDSALGISARAILKIVERRTLIALGSSITAHDMRRTCAYLMRQSGFEWDQIRAQLRHRSIGTTEKYVGQAQDLSAALLSKRIALYVPQEAAHVEG
jgi:site-specific recombinase XerD